QAKTEEVLDLIEWLRTELKAADGSLLEEWTQLAHPEKIIEKETPQEEVADITADKKSFRSSVRNTVFRLVQALARKDWLRSEALLTEMAQSPKVTPADDIEKNFASFFEEFSTLRTDPQARGGRYFLVEEGEDAWQIRQVLLDDADACSWSLLFRIPLEESRESGKPVILLEEMTGAAGSD
ncbi:MAG: DUF3516 domain-containing protein, partial [Polyangiaceae bacterium]|nr:DUF3516 domain-containing protein [Polyangiaceae bacterium]